MNLPSLPPFRLRQGYGGQVGHPLLLRGGEGQGEGAARRFMVPMRRDERRPSMNLPFSPTRNGFVRLTGYLPRILRWLAHGRSCRILAAREVVPEGLSVAENRPGAVDTAEKIAEQ